MRKSICRSQGSHATKTETPTVDSGKRTPTGEMSPVSWRSATSRGDWCPVSRQKENGPLSTFFMKAFTIFEEALWNVLLVLLTFVLLNMSWMYVDSYVELSVSWWSQLPLCALPRLISVGTYCYNKCTNPVSSKTWLSQKTKLINKIRK